VTDGAAREHRTVSRVTTILETAAASAAGASLGELASLLNAPKSSVHYLVKGLLATGYLQETADGRYEIGPAVAMLSSSGTSPVLASAHRSLETIQRACNESATLCTLVGNNVVYVDIVESTQLIRYSAPLRVRRPIYPTSAGKCFLAFMPEAKRSKYLDEHVQGAANIARVKAELRDVAQNGYSMNRGETVPDVFAVASPIIIGDAVMACLQVAGPSGRMADRMADLVALVLGEARRLSRRS
jgi:DNA-binding IclR family transcriptional regulator